MRVSRGIATGAAFVVMFAASSATEAQIYWRADVGWSYSVDADIQDKNFPVDGVICGDPACNTPGKLKDVGSSAILSGGVGWRFNRNFRADGTLSYRGWYDLDKTDGLGTNFQAGVKSWNLMANGYYDFPLAWGTPYVGAGIGWASNKMDDIQASNPIVPGAVVVLPGGTSNGFAWALMAGVGIPINPTMTLDIGGRYVDLGKIETNAGAATFAGIPLGTYSGAQGNLRAWEITVGLRF